MLEGKPNKTKLANLDFYPVKNEKKKNLHQKEFQAVLQNRKKKMSQKGGVGIDIKTEMSNGKVNPNGH